MNTKNVIVIIQILLLIPLTFVTSNTKHIICGTNRNDPKAKAKDRIYCNLFSINFGIKEIVFHRFNPIFIETESLLLLIREINFKLIILNFN